MILCVLYNKKTIHRSKKESGKNGGKCKKGRNGGKLPDFLYIQTNTLI